MEREHSTRQETFKKFISQRPLTWSIRFFLACLLIVGLEQSIKEIVNGKDINNRLELGLNLDEEGAYSFRGGYSIWIDEVESLIAIEPAAGIPNNTNNNFGCGDINIVHMCLPERRELVQAPN